MKFKNWEKFQHYKNRRPPWIKLYRTLLDDADYHASTPLACKYLPLAWIVASEQDGHLPDDLTQLAFKLRMNETDLRKVLPEWEKWIDASKTLASCKQDAIAERETETEIDTETKKNTCTEPLPKRQRCRAAVPVISPENTQITIPIIGNDGVEYPLTKDQANDWQELFPGVEVAQTLREIRAWNVANPTKRKTSSGIVKHVVSWLTREQNKGG